jgi:hypothetical protein
MVKLATTNYELIAIGAINSLFIKLVEAFRQAKKVLEANFQEYWQGEFNSQNSTVHSSPIIFNSLQLIIYY